MSLKLVSLNIEGDKHLKEVKEFLVKEDSDVVCLMEVSGERLDELLGEYPYRQYAPNFRLRDETTLGVVIAAKSPLSGAKVFYSDGNEVGELPYASGKGTHRPVMVKACVGECQIAAVHFTWTPKMSWTQKQADHLDLLLERLGAQELVMCGDFNIPRGNANYQKLLGRYQDNIPRTIQTTIDPDIHRVNKLKKGALSVVVDYAWSTPKYRVGNVRVERGVSDHCAVVCEIDEP